MHLKTRRVLPASLIEEIYPSYVQAWDHVLPHVAARHVLTFDEFAAEMTDPLISKILVLDDRTDEVLGMTTLVTDIAAVPWANADFYRDRFAAEIANGTFYYIGYSVVHRPIRGTRAIYLMVREVDRVVKRAQGVIGFDMSHFITTRGFGRRLDHVFPSSEHVDHLDTQAYYVADYRPGSSTAAAAVAGGDRFAIISMAERPELLDPLVDLLTSRWPAFLLAGHPGHDVIIQPLLRRFPEYQTALVDSHGVLRGAGLSLPLSWDGTTSDLPQGWDDAVRRSALLIETGGPPNCAVALSITVSPELSGQRLGKELISGLGRTVRAAGSPSLIAPVRPSRKSLYPLTSIEEYLDWSTKDGEVFDPWLRSHLELGAEQLGIARNSMTITGTVREWEGWLGQALPGSGAFVIAGGLDPLSVDVEADLCVYQEANVWVHHRL